MNKLIPLFIASLSVAATSAQCIPNPKFVKPRPQATALVTGVDNTNNQGTTRISFELVSAPNTSSRIDSIAMINGAGRNLASDIDGVDFSRYFQWEEDGILKIEADFPRTYKLADDASIVIYTVHGDIKATLPKKKK